MARKAFSIPYPRFTLLDKTRIWLGMAREAFYIPYPRFILLDKTRIWLGKHVSQEFMISVRPSATHPSVRHSSVCPYPRFILTHTSCSFFQAIIDLFLNCCPFTGNKRKAGWRASYNQVLYTMSLFCCHINCLVWHVCVSFDFRYEYASVCYKFMCKRFCE